MRAFFLAIVFSAPAAAASAEFIHYEASLQLYVSVGLMNQEVRMVDAAFSGLADVEAGVVSIAAGDLSAPLPTGVGFDGGTLVNGALTFSIGGAGPGETCDLIAIQERCIRGGGFGGVMPLIGVRHLGQALDAWGADAITTGTTSMGHTRVVSATRWTTGTGEAWFHIYESPFLVSGMGSFAGLPSTATAPGELGFRVVTPMVVTANQISIEANVRGLATLTVRFPSQPVPLTISTVLAGVLAAVGWARLRARSQH